MAKKKTKRELADEAWQRTQQMFFDGMVAETVVERTLVHYDAAPEHCPGCHRRQTPASGWTLRFGDLLQCGNCGHTIEVSREGYQAYAERVHAHFNNLSWEKPKRRNGPRLRGAE